MKHVVAKGRGATLQIKTHFSASRFNDLPVAASPLGYTPITVQAGLARLEPLATLPTCNLFSILECLSLPNRVGPGPVTE